MKKCYADWDSEIIIELDWIKWIEVDEVHNSDFYVDIFYRDSIGNYQKKYYLSKYQYKELKKEFIEEKDTED